MELLLFRACKKNCNIQARALVLGVKSVHTTMIQPGEAVPSERPGDTARACACPLLRQGQELRVGHTLGVGRSSVSCNIFSRDKVQQE